MRARRTVYIVIFAVASIVAAGAYYLAQPRVELVRARADIAVLTQITSDMVELVRVSPLDAPANSSRSLDAVVGRYAALPILAGQDVDGRAIEATPGSRAFGFGAPLGPGEVAFALPVAADQAVGGALSPGARVDVIAVPNALKTGTATASPGSRLDLDGPGPDDPCAPDGRRAPAHRSRRRRIDRGRPAEARLGRRRDPGGARRGLRDRSADLDLLPRARPRPATGVGGAMIALLQRSRDFAPRWMAASTGVLRTP